MIKTSKTRRLAFKGTNFRWVVPQLDPRVWDDKQTFKTAVLDRLQSSKTARKGIKFYSIAIESHTDGNPHLDLLLILQKRTTFYLDQLDFLCQKHGNLTRYRNLNQAILQYGSKQDTPLTNLQNVQHVLNEQAIKKDPYTFLQKQMRRDPYGFDLAEFVQSRGYARLVRNWSSVKTKLKDIQQATCNSLLRSKPGIKFINGDLITRTLTMNERTEFLSWNGYQIIVDYINDMFWYGRDRPFKFKHLLLVGPPNTGKTSLNRKLSEYVATYEVGMVKWFPSYKDGVYDFFSWNEFSLNVMTYPTLLKFLEGTPINLDQKGGSVLRSDNQLIIMNSNLSMMRHLSGKFGTPAKIDLLSICIQNLTARIFQLVIPRRRTLFFLLKLIQPRD